MDQKKITISYVAVVVTGITAFFLSMLWYSPLLFGQIWEQYRNASNPDMPKWTMTLAPLREVLAAFVLAHLIVLTGLSSWKATSRLMLLLWTAFHAVAMAGAVLWDYMQWQLGAVHAGDWLMKMLYMGIVLTIWLNKTKSRI